ncbi:cupin domain-containing protein [Streptomyces sp. WAC01280]|uniref:cupin domain-containing protein n=1 Tax=Streptomyces sp. WAC01280 TaxID=2487424 RepID=UPI000F7887E1|nr:cupin domain-containing protein [Streptomyces sp. WAC01280]RSS58504.1 cupin domain-containing protein [Streptomyces sp. WAC01280]
MGAGDDEQARHDRGVGVDDPLEATRAHIEASPDLGQPLRIPLARAHRVALDQLVAAPATGDPRVHLTPRRREGGSVLVPLTQYPGRVQAFKQVLAYREPRLVTHGGDEWLYVLAGEVRLILGEREVILRPGEVAEFDTGEPHWFGPADREGVKRLSLFGPHGDQAVVRTGQMTSG